MKIKINGYKCIRCGHEWVPIKDTWPKVCPKCKSPYWDTKKGEDFDGLQREI